MSIKTKYYGLELEACTTGGYLIHEDGCDPEYGGDTLEEALAFVASIAEDRRARGPY